MTTPPFAPLDGPRKPRPPRWQVLAPLILLGLMVLSMLFPSKLPAQAFYDRNAVPGNYTIGLYSDLKGESRELRLAKDQETFEVYIGVTGDSTRVFSGMVFRLDPPPGLTVDGPVVWRPVEGLRQRNALTGNGTEVNFAPNCIESKGKQPVMIGRIPFRLERTTRQVVIEPLAHRDFGLSVELCQPDKSFPKPYATGLALTVTREQSFWDRITNWFD